MKLVGPLPPSEATHDAKALFEWIETHIFYPGMGYFGDWRMEWAEDHGYLTLKVIQGEKFHECGLYYFDVQFIFLDIESTAKTIAYSTRVDPKLHRISIYGAIHGRLQGLLGI